jgi:choice-of-anchor B domain-containing protein
MTDRASFRRFLLASSGCLLAFSAAAFGAGALPKTLDEYRAHVASRVAAAPPPAPEAPMHLQPCVGGMAGGVYPCDNIDLVEFMHYSIFAPAVSESVKTNSLWGWTDPVTGHEWALLGLNNGVAFIDITDPENPFYAGKLPSHNGGVSLWRDVRAYGDHAYVVADAIPHGMQVFDLTQLRNVPNPPAIFSESGFYNQGGNLGNVHTISINEDTGYAYLVGSDTCGSRLHMVNLANPAVPAFAGCTTDGGYVHENQCFVYHGPDTTYTGHEICLAARGSALDLDIIDVTNHAAPVRLSSLQYNLVDGYSHQAWFTEDHRYILLNDELDEEFVGNPTRTWIIDAANLDAPVLSGGNGYFDHTTPSIDHNLYVHGNFVFESNYTAGLRILRLDDLAQSQLTEIGYFDLYPANDNPNFDGTWNNYFFEASGNVIATHMTQGLFILRPTNLCESPVAPIDVAATPNGDNRIDLTWTGTGTPGNTFDVERALGGCSGTFETIATDLAAAAFSDTTASGQVTYGYRIREHDETGSCASEPSICVEASTTGACTAPPLFAGLTSATNSGNAACQIDLGWDSASASCSGPTTYSVYRSTAPDFVPSAGNRIAQGVATTSFADFTAPSQQLVHYIVHAVDDSNGAEDGNLVRLSTRATGPVGDGTFATGAEIGDIMLDTGDSSPGGSPEHVGWHVSSTRAHAPSARSFWSTSGSNLCLTLEGDVTLTAAQSSQLTFWTAYDIEAGWDGGVLDISTNGGTTWTRLTPVGGYPGSIGNTGNACGFPIAPNSVFNDTSLTFAQKTVNLVSWAGQSVRLRFRYSTDSSVNPEGWYVDDIAVTHAQVPTACSSSVLLLADFEEGDTSDWSSTTP